MPTSNHLSASTLREDRLPLEVGLPQRDEVLRYLGYRGQKLTAELECRLQATMERSLDIARPVAALRSFVVKDAPDPDAEHPAVSLLGCALRLEGHDIARHLVGASEVVLMALTLGAGVDRELRRLSLTDSLEQVLFDAVATALVERAADSCEARVRAYAANKSQFCSWRFSPGYGDLPLEIQPAFLSTLDAARRLGITLTPSNLMVPTKSVTAVIGVHPTPQPGLASSCSICSLKEFCSLRAAGTTCRG